MILAKQEIHVWLMDESAHPISDDLLDSYLGYLSDEELQRYKRFKFEKHRRQFLLTRALLRTTLSRYHDSVEPCDWVFEKNAFGKPFVANALEVPLHFNLTHTKGLAALAVSRHDSLGVDVECNHRRGDLLSIADQYFSSNEINALFSLPEGLQRQRFIDLWTLKEAYVKACGQGLSIPLGDFGFSFNGDVIDIEFSQNRAENSEDWLFWQGQYLSNYTVALALKSIEQSAYRVKCFEIMPAVNSAELANIFHREKCLA